MKGLLTDYFKSLADDLRRSLTVLRKQSNRKNIHTFRVTIKRFRALLLMLEDIEPRKVRSRKAYQDFKKLFKEAGEIRDLQVQSSLLKELRLTQKEPIDLERLRLKIKSKSIRFRNKLAKFDEEKALERIQKDIRAVSSLYDNQTLTELIYYLTKRNIVKSVWLSKSNSLHKARVQLKNAHYGLEMIQDNPRSASLIAAIEPLEEKLGKLQDYAILSKLLSPSGKNFNKLEPPFPAEIKKEISRLEMEIQKKFKKLKKILSII